MNTLAYIRTFIVRTLAAVVALFAFVSCDSVIYDDEGDCSVTYRLKFRYDKNMKWADAFAHEVKSVRLYAFDSDGILAWQKSESGSVLESDDYAMTLELPAGKYHLIAWCGLDNGGVRNTSFTVPDMTVGSSRMEELQCRLNREIDGAGQARSGDYLYPLFHGMLDVELEDENDLDVEPGVYTFTMPLTKDTNHVRIILQHLSGKDVDVNDFTFQIEDRNGFMGYDNSLLADENIIYSAWNTTSGVAGLGIDDYPEFNGRRSPEVRGTITSVSVAIADLTVARMMAGHDMMLTIRTKEGRTSARIPLIDYALMLKDGYDTYMTPQDYLDRQDEYALTFFLDEDNVWIGSSIIINSWRVVFNNTDIS